MGCTFDMFSSDWNPRSYCYVLLLLCYCLPLCIIFFSYFGIIHHNTRLSARDMPAPVANIRYQPRISIMLGEGRETEVVETMDTMASEFQMQNGFGGHGENQEHKTKVTNIQMKIITNS